MRRLLCIPCGHDYKLHPLDAVDGFKLRLVQGLAHKPAWHERVTARYEGGRETSKVVVVLPSLVCDQCGATLLDGAPAVAVTMWREHEIGPWESEYLTPPEGNAS